VRIIAWCSFAPTAPICCWWRQAPQTGFDFFVNRATTCSPLTRKSVKKPPSFASSWMTCWERKSGQMRNKQKVGFVTIPPPPPPPTHSAMSEFSHPPSPRHLLTLRSQVPQLRARPGELLPAPDTLSRRAIDHLLSVHQVRTQMERRLTHNNKQTQHKEQLRRPFSAWTPLSFGVASSFV